MRASGGPHNFGAEDIDTVRREENFRDIGKVIGPASNLILGALVIAYVWRLLTHKLDPEE